MSRRWIRSLFPRTSSVRDMARPFKPEFVTLETRDVPTTFTNANVITIPSVGPADVYPSQINSTGLAGVVKSVSVTLNGVNHAASADLDVLLVGPNGVGIVLMSDNGGVGNSLSATDLTFSDAGAFALTNTAFGTGSYLPSNFDDGAADAWTGFTGKISTTGLNKTFRNITPNGTWSLYVVDDTNPDGGSFAGGWTIDIISRVNTPPVANNDFYSVNEDNVLTIDTANGVISKAGPGQDTDADAADIPTLQGQIVTGPANGSLTFAADGSFTYTPNPNYNGSDSFKYTLDDGFTTGNTATVTLSVIAQDDAPIAIDDAYVSGKNTKLSVDATRGVIRNDIHADNAPRVTLLSENFEGFTLSPYVSSTEVKTASLKDWTSNLPAGWSTTATRADDITPLIEDPVEFRGWRIHNIDSWNQTEGDQGRTQFTLGGIGAAGQVLLADGDAYDDGPDNVSLGAYRMNITTRPVDLRGVAANTAKLEFDNSFFPEGGQTGDIQVSYDGGTSFSTLFTYDTPSLGGNSSPTAVNVHVVQALNNPEGAESALVRLRYTAGNNWWWAVDNVTVTGERTAPAGLSATVVTPPTNGTLTFVPATGAFDYIPGNNFLGKDTFTYTLTDGISVTTPATVTVTVREATPNIVPVANADAYSTSINQPLTIVSNFGLLANDTDGDGDPLALAAVVAVPSKGMVAVNPAGGFTYTPNTNAFGIDTFTYTITDTFGTSTAATVTITINGGPPVITSNSGGDTAAFSIAENSTPNPLTTVTSTDPNPGGFAVTYSLSGADAKAFAIDAVNGKVTLAKSFNFELPSDANEDNVYVFAIRATNTLGLFDTQTVSVTVTDVVEAFELLSDGGTAVATRKVTENNTGVTIVKATPATGTTYALFGTDQKFFNINSTTGVVTFKALPDFETPLDANFDNKYEVTVQATNGSNMLPQALTVQVIDAVNETRAVADIYSTQKANQLVVPAASGVLVNDNSRYSLFSEGFETFTLKPFRTTTRTNATDANDPTDFTSELAQGWTRKTTNIAGDVDLSNVPNPIEFRGWNIFDIDSWNKTAGQGRNQFTLGGVGAHGSVLVADGDEFDDGPGSNGGSYRMIIDTPPISLAGADPLTGVLEFDNSFFPEGGQTGTVQVSYDDGTTFSDMLFYDTATLGGNSSTKAVNVHNTLGLPDFTGKTSAIVRFNYTAGNNWWWAIDNVQVSAGKTGATPPAAVLVTGPTQGTLVGGLKADGSFTYNPNPSFVGTDTFTYKFTDGIGDSNTTTVTLNVLSPRNLTWTGAVDGNWDVGTTANWTSGGSTTFKQADLPTFDDTGANKTITLNTTVNPGNVTFNTTGTYTLQGTGKISGTAGLAVQGTGANVILATANDYTGGTTIGTGSTLQLGSGGAIGSIVGDVVDNGTLAFNKTGTTNFAGNVTGTGAVSITNGTVNLTGANTFNGGLNLGTNGIVGFGATPSSLGSGTIAFNAAGARVVSNSALTATIPNNMTFAAINGQVRFITPTASVTTLSGILSGGSPTTEYFVQAGAGGTNNAVLELTGNNTIQGKINVQRGPVSLGSANAAGTASFFLDSNLNPNGVVRLTGDFTINNNIVVNYGAFNAIGVDGTTKAGINGVISSVGVKGIRKAGTGTLTLGGVNTFTGGTNVAAGTLLVDGSVATSSGVTVDTGTILGGIGTLPATTVAGTITGGTLGGAGKLSTGILGVTGTVQADLLGNSSGDQLAVIGSVDITGSTLVVTAPNAITGGTKFTLIDNDTNVDPVAGKFANLPNEGDSITADGQTFTISYVGGDGNDVVLTRQGVAAPNATGFTVNGGATQRSRITTITVNFDAPVVAANFNTLGAITLTRTAVASPATGIIGDIVQTGPTAANHITVSQGTATSLVLTFDNGGSFTTEDVGVENGSLSDGYWKLQVGGFNSMTGDLALRRLFGDSTVTASGQVSGDDFLDFGNFFNSNDSRYDFNNDGTISGADALVFGNRFGRSL